MSHSGNRATWRGLKELLDVSPKGPLGISPFTDSALVGTLDRDGPRGEEGCHGAHASSRRMTTDRLYVYIANYIVIW